MGEEHFGRLDDASEAEEQSSDEGGPAAAGEYDPRQGSPGSAHPAHRDGDGFSDEITHYGTGTPEPPAGAAGEAGPDAVPGTGS